MFHLLLLQLSFPSYLPPQVLAHLHLRMMLPKKERLVWNQKQRKSRRLFLSMVDEEKEKKDEAMEDDDDSFTFVTDEAFSS
ncbi:hypothetical protein E3N88_33572 [Mikania micrantha]|uniref:Uncharacterized protein n=1 Tax=Mikania micrantha TaxID=192012 RepID=A0A5N6MD02_9ASTR|nr:hypothetical protein E3N88_33572 [Mikania micrantha]